MVIERGRFDRSMGAGSSVIRRCVCSQLCIWKQSYPNPAAFGIDYGCDWCRDADAVPGDGELGTRLPAGMDDKQDLFFGAAGARADKAAGRSGEIVDSAVWKAFGKAEFFTLQPALCSDRLCRPRNRRFGSVQCHFAGRGSFSGTGAAMGDVNDLAAVGATLVINALAILAGAWLGNRAAGKLPFPVSWLGGVILIVIAVLKLC